MTTQKERALGGGPEPASQTGLRRHKPLIFVSHDSCDARLAEAFSNLLTDASGGALECFRSSDRSGIAGIEFGVHWFESIISKFGEAAEIVALLTARSRDRPWILYEAGIAYGKRGKPAIGVALGIPLMEASKGPFAQIQNCGDDENSLTKLVIQLIREHLGAEPRERAVRRQVAAFLENMVTLLEEDVSSLPIEPLKLTERCQISVGFGRIENRAKPEEHGVVVLPANEFFDDDCVLDERSALGAFVKAHCRGGPGVFREALRNALEGSESRTVEKERGKHEQSYGVGTVAFLERSESMDFNVAAVAVTTKRRGEGLRARSVFVLEAVGAIAEIAADRRLSTVYFPLLGAGHGGLSPEVSLRCLQLGLFEASRGAGSHHLRQVDITIFQKDADSAPEVSETVVKAVLEGGVLIEDIRLTAEDFKGQRR